jgi:hypothetical protein
MSILVDQDTRLVVQGLTGKEGTFHALACREYGTKVVAGVTPGKGGILHEGIPVFDTVAQAVTREGANTALIFVPPAAAADAILEAADAGSGFVCITEGVTLDMVRAPRLAGRPCRLIGPTARSDLSRHGQVGIMPAGSTGRADRGGVRSGTLTYRREPADRARDWPIAVRDGGIPSSGRPLWTRGSSGGCRHGRHPRGQGDRHGEEGRRIRQGQCDQAVVASSAARQRRPDVAWAVRTIIRGARPRKMAACSGPDRRRQARRRWGRPWSGCWEPARVRHHGSPPQKRRTERTAASSEKPPRKAGAARRVLPPWPARRVTADLAQVEGRGRPAVDRPGASLSSTRRQGRRHGGADVGDGDQTLFVPATSEM